MKEITITGCNNCPFRPMEYDLGDCNLFIHLFPNDAITEEGLIIEPEVVFYPKTKSFSVQGHPEFLGYRGWGWNLEGNDNDVHTLDYLNNLINILYYEPNYFKNLITEKINN